MNRIDEAMASWQERQKRYVERYGPELLKDREFAKVKLKALKRSLRETRGLRLTSEEKDDRNILKAQVRDLEKKITPNSTVRFVKKVFERSTDAVVIAWGIGVAIRKKIRERQNDNSYSSNVLTTIEPDYAGNRQQKDGEGQHIHARSTPLPGDSTDQNQNNTFKQPHQNRIEARRNNKQRFISQDSGKKHRIN